MNVISLIKLVNIYSLCNTENHPAIGPANNIPVSEQHGIFDTSI